MFTRDVHSSQTICVRNSSILGGAILKMPVVSQRNVISAAPPGLQMIDLLPQLTLWAAVFRRSAAVDYYPAAPLLLITKLVALRWGK